jgi:hypothetical protein
MPRPTWNEILAGDVYVVNMERSGERWRQTRERVVAAGFSEARVRRLVAVDASQPDALEDAWNTLFPMRPTLDLVKDPEFRQYVGKQGCFLSHVKLWKWMVETGTPWVTLFEDDVLFHPDWAKLAPKYYARTPGDWELIYLGSQMDFKSTYPIDRGAVYCTHAMLLSLTAATRLYAMVCSAGARLYTIDNLFHDLQASGDFPVSYYIWNGQCFPTALAKMGKGWERRNHGLVFQDESMGSYIKDYY